MKFQFLVSCWVFPLCFRLSIICHAPIVNCQIGTSNASWTPIVEEATTELEIPTILAKCKGKGKGDRRHCVHHHHPPSSPSTSSFSLYLPPHSHPKPYFITRWIMNVKGAGQGQIISLPGSNLDIICFEPIALYRLDNYRNIGNANICISILRSLNLTTTEFLSDTTTFDVVGGSFTSQTNPFVESVETDGLLFVVSTTSIITTTSQTQRNDNIIIKGDGCFTGVMGNARVSGYLEANFTSRVFYFDYIYAVDLNLTINDGCYFLHQPHE